MTEQITDVTDALRADGHLIGEDENPEDRVYRFGTEASGRLIKVKTFHDLSASAHGREVYRISGSAAGSNGKALRREDGTPAVYDQQRMVIASADSDTDLGVDIEVARRECVRDTTRAHRLSFDATALTGVGVMRDRDDQTPAWAIAPMVLDIQTPPEPGPSDDAAAPE